MRIGIRGRIVGLSLLIVFATVWMVGIVMASNERILMAQEAVRGADRIARLATQMEADFYAYNGELNRYVLTAHDHPNLAEISYRQAETYQGQLDHTYRRVRSLDGSTAALGFLQRIAGDIQSYEGLAAQAHRQIRQGHWTEGMQTQTEGNFVPATDLPPALDGLVAFERSRAQEAAQAFSRVGNRQFLVVAALAIVVFVTLMVSYLSIRKRIIRPVLAASAMATRLAEGDLGVPPLRLSGRDEMRDLGESLNRMVDKLRQMLGRISHTGVTITDHSRSFLQVAAETSTVAERFAATVSALAAGTTQQAAALEGSSRRVADLQDMIGRITERARYQDERTTLVAHTVDDMHRSFDRVHGELAMVTDLTRAAAGQATQGSGVVGRTVEGLHHIREAVQEAGARLARLGQTAERIAEMLSGIREITDQTNLLALNATIEAARAGEHGRGFGVVAGEVRKLAERSHRATEEIRHLLEDVHASRENAAKAMDRTIHEAERGVALGQEAGSALAAIEERVRQVAGEVEGIASAMEEAVAQTDSVSQAVTEVAAVTAENRQAAERMLAASGEVAAAVEQIAATGEDHQQALAEVAGGTSRLQEATAKVLHSAWELAALSGELEQEMADFQAPTEVTPVPPALPQLKALPSPERKRSA